jgi:hypothetical protein
MPRADATELAPKKSAHHSPPAVPDSGAGGLSVFQQKNKTLHFFGETPERRPWAKNARPAAFAGRSNWFLVWDTRSAYTEQYPIPPPEPTANQTPLKSAKMPGNYSDNIGAK